MIIHLKTLYYQSTFHALYLQKTDVRHQNSYKKRTKKNKYEQIFFRNYLAIKQVAINLCKLMFFFILLFGFQTDF